MKKEILLIVSALVFTLLLFILNSGSPKSGNRVLFEVLAQGLIFYLILRYFSGKIMKPGNFADRIFRWIPNKDNSKE